MKLKVYLYDQCSSCRNALKFLAARGLGFETVPIRERPPGKAELKRMLAFQGGNIRRLFNTAGQDYRALKLSARLPAMTVDDAIELLSKNGNLVKRPFALTGDGGVVGFEQDEWERLVRGPDGVKDAP